METPIASLVLAALLAVGSLAQEPGPPDADARQECLPSAAGKLKS